MPPFFSIVTATYNAGATLACLLDSLAAQSCRDFELVVQDGGSVDDTIAVLESYRSCLPALSLASGPDSGIYDAWNKALRVVRGQWVLFLGADDRLAGPTVLQSMKGALLLVAPEVLYAVGGVTLFAVSGEYYGEYPVDVDNAVQRLRREMIFCHTGVLHRRSVFRGELFDSTYRVLGDYDFFCRTVLDDRQVAKLDVTVTHMALGGVSSRLCSQPRIFLESLRIAMRHAGAISSRHMRVGCVVAAVALLCRVLGPVRAAGFVNITRKWRGKRPFWS